MEYSVAVVSQEERMEDATMVYDASLQRHWMLVEWQLLPQEEEEAG